MTKQSPFVVHGSSFRGSERVTVLLVAGKTWTRRAVADASRAFIVRFGVDMQTCDSFDASASRCRSSKPSCDGDATLPPVTLDTPRDVLSPAGTVNVIGPDSAYAGVPSVCPEWHEGSRAR